MPAGFAATYGPINKTTFGEAKAGRRIRRMPNLVKFREDPDAMLVMSLEEYDEVTGRARKAAIMRKDVVGKIRSCRISVAALSEDINDPRYDLLWEGAPTLRLSRRDRLARLPSRVYVARIGSPPPSHARFVRANRSCNCTS